MVNLGASRARLGPFCGILSGLQQLFTTPVTPVAAGSAGGASHRRSKKGSGWASHAVAALGIEGVLSTGTLRAIS
jgi:hypothetical protein